MRALMREAPRGGAQSPYHVSTLWQRDGGSEATRAAWAGRTVHGFMVNRPQGMPYFPPAEVDPPLQRALRAVLEPFLKPRAAAAFESQVRTHANTLIDAFIAQGEVELVSQFATPLPQYVFSTAVAGMDREELPYLLNAFSFVGPESERAQNFLNGMTRIERYMRPRPNEAYRGNIVDALIAFEHAGVSREDKVGTP